MIPSQTTLGPGAKLRAARELASIDRRELASRLKISYQRLSDIEADRWPMTLDKIHEISLALGIDPHQIDSRLASTSARPKR